MIRLMSLVVALVSCLVVAVPGAHASQRLAGSTGCQLVPTSLVTGPDGNIWYTVAPAGSTTNLGGSPQLPFHSPVPQSAVVPLQAGTSIYRVTRQGKVTAFPISRNAQARFTVDYITSGPGGNLWFTARTDAQVFIGRMTPRGGSVEYPIRVSEAVSGIAPGTDGNIWFSVSGVPMIGRMTPRGDVTQFPAPIAPGQLFRGPDGNVWFNTGYSLGRITPQGEVKPFSFSNKTTANSINAVTIGPDGHLWFTNQYNQVVRVIAPDVATPTSIPEVFASSNRGVSNLATGSDHNLWFITDRGVVVRMTLRGQFIGFDLSRGMEYLRGLIRGADGNLWFAAQGGWIGRMCSAL